MRQAASTAMPTAMTISDHVLWQCMSGFKKMIWICRLCSRCAECVVQGMAQPPSGVQPLRPPGEGADFMPAFAQKSGLRL